MNFKKKSLTVLSLFLVVMLGILAFEIFVPLSVVPTQPIIYTVKKGMGDEDIAHELRNGNIIRSRLFFEIYAKVSLQYAKLQAGKYSLSSSLSIFQIVQKLAAGDVVKQKVTIQAGWNINDIAKYLEENNIYTKREFLTAVYKNFYSDVNFLNSKPKNLSLEGYLFPDTYYVDYNESVDLFVKSILSNFDKQLTPDLRIKIASEHKTIFQIVTMASILEEEVRSLKDKKIVAGILWKRIADGMPLQVDSTVNYAKNVAENQQYNTYKNKGLPLGPISNPGIDSIVAAMYPTDSPYWFYLSAKGTGETIFSKTGQEHLDAIKKYLR